MALTWDSVTAIAPELATLAEASQAAILSHVDASLSESALGGRYAMAAAYLAAHLGTLTARGGGGPGGPVTAESAGDVSVSYAGPSGTGAVGFEATGYGRQYLATVRTSLARIGLVL